MSEPYHQVDEKLFEMWAKSDKIEDDKPTFYDSKNSNNVFTSINENNLKLWKFYKKEFNGYLELFYKKLFNWKNFVYTKDDIYDAILIYKDVIKLLIHDVSEEEAEEYDLLNQSKIKFEKGRFVNTYRYINLNEKYATESDLELKVNQKTTDGKLYYEYNPQFVKVSVKEIFENWVLSIINIILDDNTNTLFCERLKEAIVETLNSSKHIYTLNTEDDVIYYYDFNLYVNDSKFSKRNQDPRRNVVNKVFYSIAKYSVSLGMQLRDTLDKEYRNITFISKNDLINFIENKTGNSTIYDIFFLK